MSIVPKISQAPVTYNKRHTYIHQLEEFPKVKQTYKDDQAPTKHEKYDVQPIT